MGFSIGSVFKSVTSVIKPIAQAAIRAAAPAATNLLKSIVGSGFDGIKNLAGNWLKTALPGPLGSLASKLLGKGADALKGLAQGGVEKLLQQLVNKLAPRQLGGGQNVTPPTISDRGTPAATSSMTSAATAAAATATGASSASGNTQVDKLFQDAARGPASDLEAKAKAMGVDTNSQEFKMLKFQEELQRQSRMMNMLSQIMQAHHDMQKQIIGNFRA